jgi:transposase
VLAGRPSVDDREWLRRRYVDDQASVRHIAAQADCSTSTVRRALAAAEIPTRSRGRRSRLRLVEAEQLLRLVATHGRLGAALELGVDPRTLDREVRRLGILEQAKAAMRTYRRVSGSSAGRA